RVVDSDAGAANSDAAARECGSKTDPASTQHHVSGSTIQVAHAQCIGLDELAARLDFLAHQAGKYFVRRNSILDLNAEQAPRLRVHRGFPELLRIHLAQTFVALDRDGA